MINKINTRMRGERGIEKTMIHKINTRMKGEKGIE